VDRPSIATAEITVPGAPAVQPQVTVFLRDTSMRILEAALAIGALATALLLGLGR
jgi:hypothetical protein